MTRTLSKQPRSSVWWTVMALLAGSSVLGAAQAQTAARTATAATASASVVTQTAWHGQNQSGGFMMGRALNAVYPERAVDPHGAVEYAAPSQC